jgi:hypothetical protein
MYNLISLFSDAHGNGKAFDRAIKQKNKVFHHLVLVGLKKKVLIL